jgi:DNA ligase D-like protein (predicted ligase)
VSDPFARLDESERELLQPARAGFVAPMLATLTDDRFSDPAWIYERKLDGIRFVGARDGSGAHLWSRSEHALDATYPELVDAVAEQVRPGTVVDGEIVAFDGSRTSFERLQGRSGLHDAAAARASGIPVFGYVFDAVVVDGHDITALPLRRRKSLLRAAVTAGGPIRLSPHRNGAGAELLADACARGWEGLIAKRADAPYRPGRRSPDWLKLKCVHAQELVIGGWTDPEGSRTGLGALLVGYYDGGDLRYAGKVGTGFDRHVLDDLASRMRRLAADEPPFAEPVRDRGVHWVRPELVAQIGFGEWTRDGRLRHPRYLGLREDKAPEDVVREEAS